MKIFKFFLYGKPPSETFSSPSIVLTENILKDLLDSVAAVS
jgi:hypothetical protein